MYADAAPLYLRKGWNTPLPILAGYKYPPPDDLTGNFPEVDPNTIESLINEVAHEDGNTALRMPRIKRHEIIGIDVDQYGDKHGWETLLRIVAECGPLPATVKSSSRGNDVDDPDSPSGIHYFRVPANKKWRGKLGADIEIIQKTHRYSIVWPSEYEGRIYRWYATPVIDGPEIETTLLHDIPHVDTIPTLPAAWQAKLLKGAAGRVRKPGDEDDEITDPAAARRWCSKNMPGWNELPSTEMHRMTDPTRLSKEMTDGAHDVMVSRIHRIVRLGAEGHHGLREGLKRVYRAFREETLGEIEDEAARRDLTSMQLEYDRALVGEVSKLKQDVADNLAMISPIGGYSADDVNIDATPVQAQLRERARRRNRAVNIGPRNNDRERGKMLREFWAEDLIPINGAGLWVMWDMIDNRLVRCTTADLYYACELAIEQPLEAAAAEAYARADALEAAGDPDAKAVRKQAADLARRAQQAGQKSVMEAAIAVAHALPGPRMNLAEFDAEPLTLGVANGVLDFSRTVTEPGELLRSGRPEDRILGNTRVEFDDGVACPEWDSFLDVFLPEPGYRRFVRKVFGYCLLAGNPARFVIFLQGRTSTGKTTMQDAVQAALGKDYCDYIAANALFREKSDAGPAPEILEAMSRRVMFASEVGMHNRLHADAIKRLTGGRDRVSARALYSNAVVSRIPSFTPVIATNSVPTIVDGDDALWRRLLVLPFDEQVPEDTVPRPGIAHARGGPQAVLLWLVAGLLDYLREGLDPAGWPDVCRDRIQDFIRGTSDFQSFFHERLIARPGARAAAADVHAAYKTWALVAGVKESNLLSQREFIVKMESNGAPRFRTSYRPTPGERPRSRYVFGDVRLRKLY